MKKIALLSLLLTGVCFAQTSVAVKTTVHDTAQILRTYSRSTVHDTLAVRVPQAIDTAATPRFHSMTIAYTGTGSTTALLATGNCPAHTGTAPDKWIGLIYINGDTLWVPGWK